MYCIFKIEIGITLPNIGGGGGVKMGQKILGKKNIYQLNL